MNSEHGLNGSTWRRWDLHIHAPGTKLSNGYGHPNEDNLKSFVEELQKSDVQAFGVTDYCCFDGYQTVVSAYKKHFPSGEKLFIPNIEFRLTETVSSDGRNVHTHVLIDPEYSTETKLQQLLSDLYTHKTRDDSRLRCSELSTEQEYVEATVSLQDLKGALKKVFPDETKYLIVTAGNNDGLRGVDTKSPRSMSISDELDKASHAFFGKSNNTKHFLNENRYEDESTAENKPVFDGSDAHSFEELKRLSGCEIITFLF